MKRSTVFIDGWQIQCCGDHFKIGESVKWRVGHYGKTMEHYESIGEIDYYYENHPTRNDGYFTLTGIVTGIDIMFTRLVPDPSKGDKWLKRSDPYTKAVKEAAIWVDDENEHEFDGYIAHFEDCQIRSEEKDEQYPRKLRYKNLERLEEGFNELYTDEIIASLINESGGMLNRDLIRKKFTVDVLRNKVGGSVFYYFDDDSYEKLDLKIEVLTDLRKGKIPKDIPNYSEIFELLPDDIQLLNCER